MATNPAIATMTPSTISRVVRPTTRIAGGSGVGAGVGTTGTGGHGRSGLQLSPIAADTRIVASVRESRYFMGSS